MKNRTDKILVIISVVSFLLDIFLVLTYLEIIPIVDHWNWPYWANSCFSHLALGFSAVPVFCLQLLLCRRKRHWVAALPALIIIGAALWFTYGFFTATGWDTLGWGILMVLSIAPAVGCALGWAAYGLGRLYRKGDVRNA